MYRLWELTQVAKSPMAPNIAVAYTIGDGGVVEAVGVTVPEATLCSVLDMGIHAENHLQSLDIA